MKVEEETIESDPENSRETSKTFLRPVLLIAGTAAFLLLWTVLVRKSASPEEVLLSDTLRIGDRLFVKGQTNHPFTGFVLERYSSGSPKSRSAFKDGALHGLSEGWHTNGVIQVREQFRRGVSHGTRTKFYADGARLSEAAIVDGELSGVYRKWHENGQLSQEITMKNGQPDGVSRSWYPSGHLKAEAVLEMGEVIEQKFWDDGEMETPAGTP